MEPPGEDSHRRQSSANLQPLRSASQNIPSRAISNASKGTIPLSLFRDFDGVHFSSLASEILDESQLEEIEQELGPRPSSADELSQRMDAAAAEPPPDDDMIFYPAPVPANLNLPPRLSKQSPAAIRLARRSAVLGSLPQEARHSAVWLDGDVNSSEQGQVANDHAAEQTRVKQRQSMLTMKRLPPQLRASVFFDQPAVPHDVELRNGSAVMTLDHLLDESAKAPAGQLAGSALAPRTRNRRSTTSLLQDDRSEVRNSRASMMTMSRAGSSLDGLTHLDGRKSVTPLSRPGSSIDFIGEHQRSRSKLSFATNLNDADNYDSENYDDGKKSDHDFETTPFDNGPGPEELCDEHAEEEGENAQEEEEPGFYGPPTNLIAELQMRKHELRQRNRTAANSFPNGMHSTLLQLDAVAQIEKKRRQGKHTKLAWEDPDQMEQQDEEGDDDDVPLGMLFPHHGFVKHSGEDDKPLGLIAQRDREDNEPLSKRRNRMLGIRPPLPPQSQLQATPNSEQLREEEEQNSEHEGETLAQRTRRIRSRKALDDALAGAGGDPSANGDNRHSRALSSDFASEWLSQFGGPGEKNKGKEKDTGKGKGSPNPNVEATHSSSSDEHQEETLGQRRRRLQAEAQARQTSNGSGDVAQQPGHRPTSSLANILAANPITSSGLHPGFRNVSGSSSGAGLLGQNAQRDALRRQQISEQNQWLSTGLPAPLVTLPDKGKSNNFRGGPSPGFDANMRAGFAGGKFNDGTGGVGANIKNRASMVQLGLAPNQSRNAAQGWDGMFGGGQFQHGLGATQSPSPYGGFGAQPARGHGVQQGPNASAMVTQQLGQFPGQDEETMSPVEREKIENWRMSVIQ